MSLQDKLQKLNFQNLISISTLIKDIEHFIFYGTLLGIVRENNVIGLEKEGGTQKMLQKIKKNKLKKNGVLVKLPKKKQDLRVDLPTVGLNTFKQLKLAGLKGVVVKANRNIFLDKEKCIRFANKNKMFITVK